MNVIFFVGEGKEMGKWVDVSIKVGLLGNVRLVKILENMLGKEARSSLYFPYLSCPIDEVIELTSEQANEYATNYLLEREKYNLQTRRSNVPRFNWIKPWLIMSPEIEKVPISKIGFAYTAYLDMQINISSLPWVKDPDIWDPDFERYIRFLLALTEGLPILSIETDNEVYWDEYWVKDEPYVGFQLQESLPQEFVQKVDVTLCIDPSKESFKSIFQQGLGKGYAFALASEGFQERDLTLQELLDLLPDQGPLPEEWLCRNNGILYHVRLCRRAHIGSLRLIMKVLEQLDVQDLRHIVDCALVLTYDFVIQEFRTFDSRHNCV